MAIFYMRTSLIKASAGKSAVASAAYISGTKLHDNKTGQDFSYTNKEEVLYSEVLLPKYAPPEFKNRETLWNAVENDFSDANSRYARQFIIAIPREWSDEESISRCKEFIQNVFVKEGMAVDWSFHNTNSENPHIHVMCTTRGFNKDGTWQRMEKKVYELDESGNKIPVIDPDTGQQKIRTRKRNGKEHHEKLWKRKTIQANTWNSKAKLKEWKKEWQDFCNRFLSMEQQINCNAYEHSELLPSIHEGAGARIEYSSVTQENQVRRNYNQRIKKLQALCEEERRYLHTLQPILKKEKIIYEKRYHSKTNSLRGHANGFVTTATAFERSLSDNTPTETTPERIARYEAYRLHMDTLIQNQQKRNNLTDPVNIKQESIITSSKKNRLRF